MLRQRDICLMPFPFSEGDAEKRRPVLVITSSVFNATGADIIVMAITSRLDNPYPCVYIDETCLDSGRLPAPSLVLPHKVFTISQKLVEGTVGRLNREHFEKALACLGSHLTDS